MKNYSEERYSVTELVHTASTYFYNPASQI